MSDEFEGELVAVVRKNSREEIRVTRRTWQGHDLVDARVFEFPADGGGDGTATRKGLSLRVETWRELLPVLSEALGIATRGNAAATAGEDTFADPADPVSGDPWGQ